jgi:hypothetical protein
MAGESVNPGYPLSQERDAPPAKDEKNMQERMCEADSSTVMGPGRDRESR